jgi:hypothetical protein
VAACGLGLSAIGCGGETTPPPAANTPGTTPPAGTGGEAASPAAPAAPATPAPGGEGTATPATAAPGTGTEAPKP